MAAVVAAALLLTPDASLAAAPSQCSAPAPTETSYTWDFHKEASDLLNALRTDAQKTANAADELRILAQNPAVDWVVHAARLREIRDAVNDMGAKLCRLEAIRPAALPWQQETIDRVGPAIRLMADNADDATLFLNEHQGNFWVPTYEKYMANLFTQAGRVSGTVKNFEQYAHLKRELSSVEKSIQVPGAL